jgi:hypothetical protein
MKFLAYDNVEGHSYFCGPSNGNPWSRDCLTELIRIHDPYLKNNLRPTSELLSSGEPFAYILSWRYYYEYSSESDGINKIRRAFQWLLNSPVLSAIQSGQCKLVLIDWYEGIYGQSTLTYHPNDKFSCFFNTFDIPPHNVFFVDANSRSPEHQRIFSPRRIFENFFEWSAYSTFIIGDMIRDPVGLSHPIGNKPFRFLSYSRHWNTMRQYLTFDLYDRDLLKHGLVSCSRDDGNDINGNGFYLALSQWTPSASRERANDFLKTLPMILDADLSVNQADSLNIEHHLQTDISIINETHSNPETIFLSEKTFRAILLKHPFLMMSSPGTLALLRKCGYETYSCLFDESYDEEPDLFKRKELVLNELTKFINLDHRERTLKLFAAEQIAQVNQRHFLNQLNRRLVGQNLLDALSE